jgi:hypothetical protein
MIRGEFYWDIIRVLSKPSHVPMIGYLGLSFSKENCSCWAWLSLLLGSTIPIASADWVPITLAGELVPLRGRTSGEVYPLSESSQSLAVAKSLLLRCLPFYNKNSNLNLSG